MSVARDTIKELRNPGNHKVAKTDIKWNLNTSTRSNQWVQWNVRKIKGVRTYYEVYNPDPKQEILWVEFHVKARTFQILESVSGLEKLLERSKDSMYGVKVDVRDMNVDAAVREVQLRLDHVYNLVEQRLKKRGVTIMPLSNGNGEPWYVGWSCDDKCLDKSYDKEFRKLKKSAGLTWLPWVGKYYGDPEINNSRILVVGESNYAAKNWMEYVNNDECYTRKVIDYSCMVRRERISTMSNIALLLKRDEDSEPVERSVWSRIAYCDVCQSCVENGNQPCRDDFSSGFPILLRVIEILAPSIVVFAGTRVVGCAGLDYERGNKKINRSYGYWGCIQDNRTFVAVKHPGRFFTVEEWRNFLQERGVI